MTPDKRATHVPAGVVGDGTRVAGTLHQRNVGTTERFVHHGRERQLPSGVGAESIGIGGLQVERRTEDQLVLVVRTIGDVHIGTMAVVVRQAILLSDGGAFGIDIVVEGRVVELGAQLVEEIAALHL